MMMGHVCQNNGQRLGEKCKSLITRHSLPFWVVFHFWGFCWQLEEIRWSRWWIQICLIFTPIPGVSWSYLQRRILFKRVGGFNHPTSDCWPSLFRHKAEAYGFVLNSSWKEGETCGKKIARRIRIVHRYWPTETMIATCQWLLFGNWCEKEICLFHHWRRQSPLAFVCQWLDLQNNNVFGARLIGFATQYLRNVGYRCGTDNFWPIFTGCVKLPASVWKLDWFVFCTPMLRGLFSLLVLESASYQYLSGFFT